MPNETSATPISSVVSNGRLRLEYAQATRRRLVEGRVRREIVARFAERYQKAGYIRRFWLDLEIERSVRVESRQALGNPSDSALFVVRSHAVIPSSEDVADQK